MYCYTFFCCVAMGSGYIDILLMCLSVYAMLKVAENIRQHVNYDKNLGKNRQHTSTLWCTQHI